MAGAATRVGETLPIRIDEVTARAVRASINGGAVEQPVAAEPVFEAAMPGDAAPAAGDDGEPKPKKRTRRGSRGGRGRKKKPPVAAETEDAGPTNGAEPTETADAGEGGSAEDVDAVAAEELSENGAEKPKKKTRRGSRGGRNRRKKPAAAGPARTARLASPAPLPEPRRVADSPRSGREPARFRATNHMTYAIIALGGKQYRVQEGEWLLVERLPYEEGKTSTRTSWWRRRRGQPARKGE